MTRSMPWVLPVVLASSLALAQEEDLSSLEGLLDSNVVSSASRSAERSDDAPATIVTVTREDLRRYGLMTVADAVNFFSLGMVTQDPLHSVEAGGRGVMLSGDYGNHVLLLIDGHLMNEAWNGTAYFEQGAGVPIDFIDHIEIITGPGSVLYGSFAMLGVINVVTRTAKDVSGVSLMLEGAAEPPIDASGNPELRTDGLGFFGRVSAVGGNVWTLGGKPFELVAGVELYGQRGAQVYYPVQSGYTDGDADGTRTWPYNFGPRSAGPGSWGGLAKNQYTLVPSGLVKATWGEFEVWVHGALYQRATPATGVFGNTYRNFDAPGQYERDTWLSAELRWHHDLSSKVSLQVRGYFDSYVYASHYESSSWTHDGSGPPPSQDVMNFTFFTAGTTPVQWFGGEAQVNVDWLGDGRFPFMAGVDARGKHYAPYGYFETTDGHQFNGALAYEKSEYLVAPYVQQRARLLPSLQANVGLRLDVAQGFAPTPSPRAALVWSAPWEGRVKAVFSSAFRSPSAYERFTEYAGYQIANPDLKPETVLTGELTYEQKLGRHHVGVVGWYSRYNGLIRFVQAPADHAPNGESWYANASSFDNFGFTAFADGAADKVRYGASFTWTRNVIDTPLVVVPPWQGNFHVSYDFGERQPSLALAGFIAAPRLADSANATGEGPNGETITWDQGTLAPPQVDIRATLLVPLGPPGLSLRAVVGSSLTPYSAYTVGPRLAPDAPAQSPELTPNAHRLFAMLTLLWSIGGEATSQPTPEHHVE
jgi:iron complex outermembrane receptor protein